MNLLTVSNPKTQKSVEYGYLTGILHLKPNYTICPNASKGCMAACLNTAGRGQMNAVQEARQRRTVMYMTERDKFMSLLVADIEKMQRQAKKKSLKLAIRLNGTSDIAWEEEAPELFKQFRDVQFYDYTPNHSRITYEQMGFIRLEPFDDARWPSNYKLCHSLKEDNMEDAMEALNDGGNVAVVFRTDQLPDTWKGYKVVSGDEHDLRFLDPVGVVVGLKAKGKAIKDTSGFVQEVA